MKYFFITLFLFSMTQTLFAGSFSSKGEEPLAIKDAQKIDTDRKDEKQIEKAFIEILPVVSNEKNTFMDSQLVKMAIRHISSQKNYQLAIGEMDRRIISKVPIEALEMKVFRDTKNKRTSLELRVFDLQSKLLLRKMREESINDAVFLRHAESLFEKLFGEEGRKIIPE